MSDFSIGKISYSNTRTAGACSSQPIRPVGDAAANPTESKKVVFGNVPAAQNVVSAPATTLVTPQEKQMYNTIAGLLDKKTKPKLDELLKTGRLLDKRSNDNSNALDNMYKIASTTRMRGLDKSVILNELVSTLQNPFLITQKFGDVPKSLQKEIVDGENNYIRQYNSQNTNLVPMYSNGTVENRQHREIAQNDLNVKSNCCVAASIEFNIAHRTPAEFARMAEQLTSEKMSVTKVLDPKLVAVNYIDAVWQLKEFKTPHKFNGWDRVEVELNPDRNAVIRARIQNSYKDKGERSLIDVLMQSMLMNVGSQQTYNTLTDLRTGKFNTDNEGLTNIEKNYAESLATGKNTILVTYQIMDDNYKLLGYECSFDEMKKHITDTLNLGDNVIIGYTYMEPDGSVNKGGHEITILGIEKDAKGVEYFICKDTDNSNPVPIKYKVDEFLPRIHHAGVPMEVLKGNVEFIDTWVEVLNQYKAEKTQQPLTPLKIPNPVNNNMPQNVQAV